MISNAASVVMKCLYTLLARRVFMAPLRATTTKVCPLVRRGDVISIVDDDASMRRAIQRLIESAALVAEEFASAEEFLL